MITPAGRRRYHHRGTILIVVLILTVVLAGMTLVLCRAARVELLASANHVSAAQAASAERAGEQFAIQQIVQNGQDVLTLDETYFEAVPVGNAGYFWFVRPDFQDASLPLYGLIDEASKLNINYATTDMMQQMGIPPELADSIVDWVDADSDVTGTDGAEDDYYAGRPNPYSAKNEPFESVEELLLVKGASPQILYGQNYGLSGGNNATLGGVFGDDLLRYGLINYVTVYSKSEATGQAGGGGAGGGAGGGGQTATVTGKININTAPREVLLALPNLDEGDVSAIMQARVGQTGIDWVQSALGDKAAGVTQYITGESKQYSADILAASADGRAFKRVRVVIDAADDTNPPKIVYRRDITADGWPLDVAILDSLRAGNGPGAGALGTTLGRALR